ncbi:unnamed protein product [Plutella xylostella]|uniref:(diamondback moth) hypothetical protein n=1 Tax=Plutella xylostella TaxID=51655 RepID=A0A8S4G3F4_PLUXY|nr:unnamed protein product [Plutella xylostella]
MAHLFSMGLSAAGVRTVEVQAVEGMAARFPCDLASPNNDKVYMVFWFRDDAGIPLYSAGTGKREPRRTGPPPPPPLPPPPLPPPAVE